MPSTICAKLYSNIQAKYFEYIGFKEKENDKSKVESIETENWNRGNKRKRNETSYYFNNYDFVNMGKSKRYNFESIECSEFEKVYGHYLTSHQNFEETMEEERIIEEFYNHNGMFFFILYEEKFKHSYNV